MRLFECYSGNLMIDHLQGAIGGNDVDVISRELLPSGDLCDRHARPRGQDVRQLTAPLRIEMHHHHIGSASVRWERPDKGLECLNSAGGRPDGDDDRVSITTLAISVAVLLAGAAGCLLLRRHSGAVPDAPPSATTRPAPQRVTTVPD